MGVQDLVTTAGPWVAAGGGVVTAVTALARSVGTRRLRSEVAATTRLLKDLPDEAPTARSRLEETLEVQTTRLLNRTRNGVRLSRSQSHIIMGGLTVATNIGMVGLVTALRSAEAVPSEGSGALFVDVVEIFGLASVAIASFWLIGGMAGVFEEWMYDRTSRVPPTRNSVGNWFANVPAKVVLSVPWLVKQIKKPFTRGGGTTPTGT